MKLMTPTIDESGVPDVCLSLRLRSDWGHFKKFGRTASKQTFRIIPRTTLAGLLAGIVGVTRDGYYKVFSGESSTVAITPESPLRVINIPTTGVGTDPDQAAARTAGSSRSRSITYQDTTQNRQIHNYEVIVDPAYRIDIAVEDESFYTELRTHLADGTSIYPPSMGISEYLASVEYLGEFTPDQPSKPSREIDSVVPCSLSDVVPQPGASYRVERSPAIMERYRGGRRTIRFDDIVYTPDPEANIRLVENDLTPVDVDGRRVIFR